ncbi:nuclear protein Es2-domain-containing protein [Mariannaea sp. PMI_226]|nr:nuclear protein Es2-domain-containing protein [Mariannaea sp. PMI_226]
MHARIHLLYSLSNLWLVRGDLGFRIPLRVLKRSPNMDPSQSGTSSALVRKRVDTELMPPPPPAKKIKRPKKVLDEDEYTDTLSQIIARDFFPGLLETETQQEYLDALDSKDAAWISSAGRRLQQVMTPGRRNPAARSLSKPVISGDQTPSAYGADTPASFASVAAPRPPRLSANMSLSKFQETYTSEDNESFYKLLDKQNQKKAEKYAWLWRGNKLPSKQMIKQKEVEDRLSQTRSLIDDGYKRDRLAIKDRDDRPARPDTWDSNPKNTLMFGPDGVEDGVVTVSQKAEEASKMAPKSIMYANTRMPQPHVLERPPSPTMSAVRDAIAGKPRREDQDSSVVGGGETPRVNGYAFVDDEDDEPELAAPVINLGPGDDSPNPFKIQDQRKRESLHERMVDRIAKSKKEASKNGLTGKVDKTPVPKFPSSPRVSVGLTPAAKRLWSNMGTPGRTPGNSFGQSTPMKPRGSLLRSVSRASSSSGAK